MSSERLEKTIQKFHRTVSNLQPENRIGVVADIAIDHNNPLHAQVIIDRGKRNQETHGVPIELQKIIIKTKKILSEDWHKGDFVTIGWLGIIHRLASPDELGNFGFDVDQFLTKFHDWKAFKKDGAIHENK